MDDLNVLDLILFATATFAAAFITGIAGFAFGVIAAAAWLHLLPPPQVTALIIAFGLMVQGATVWKLRRAIKWPRLMPFLVGSAIGVPLGGELLRWASADSLRIIVGVILILFSLHGLLRPKLGSAASAGRASDGAIGVVNGVIGGATGLAGIVAVIWCGLRGWPPAEQRAVFQPTGVAVFVMTALWLGGTGMIGGETVGLFLIGLVPLALGTWLGFKLFGRLDESAFRRVVLVLLLASGIGLFVAAR